MDYAPRPTPKTFERDEGAEISQILQHATTAHLNEQGRSEGGPATCPRQWFIHPSRPPHVSQLAWEALTPQVRDRHRRWLHDLRAMPAELLDRNLASAAIEMVRAMATMRHWKWSTVAKNLAMIAGALRDLPLYTNQTDPIELNHYPEWRAAMQAASRLEKESVAEPPAPVTLEEYHAARKELQTKAPLADLYLAMMWAFAARAGDIASLQAQDVSISATTRQSDGTVGVVLEMKRNKGARARKETYTVPSTMQREDASELLKLQCSRPPKAPLFPKKGEDLRDLIRTALRRSNRDAALPSVRKGAIRHLVAKGMPLDQLMMLTGHTQKETLWRYAFVGHRLPVEAAVTQDSAAKLHQPQSSSG